MSSARPVSVEVPCEEDNFLFVRQIAREPHGILSERTCAECKGPVELHAESLTEDGGLVGCLACGHPELFTQKDFPRRIGFTIVAAAAVLAPFTNYISLGVAAALDCVLYFFAPEMVECYVCRARHRGFPLAPRHPRFDRTIEERLKFGENAVMGSPMREGGTAGAPEPEH